MPPIDKRNSSQGIHADLPRAILQRLDSSDEGVFGEINFPGGSARTGELPWRDNLANVSCIPVGQYLVEWTFSPKFNRNTYELRRVPSRSGIRIHPANFMGDVRCGFKSELNGCIALGREVRSRDGQKSLWLSQSPVRELERAFGAAPFILEIRALG